MKFNKGDIVSCVGNPQADHFFVDYRGATFQVLSENFAYGNTLNRVVITVKIRSGYVGGFSIGHTLNLYEDTLELVEVMTVCKKVAVLEQRHKKYMEKKQQKIDYDSIPF